MSRPILLLLPFALAFATTACGGGDGDGDGRDASTATVAVADDDAADPLPAPMQAPGGAVTGMPDDPGPGNVPLADEAAPQPPADARATLYVDGVAVSLLGEEGSTALPPLRDATTGRGVAVAGSALPPLEDNPETGLGPEGYIEVSRAPPGGNSADAVADAAAAAAGTSDADAGRQAAAAVRAYYDAIGAGDYRRAYAAWSDGGRSSGRSPEQFASTFAGTRIVRVSIGAPGRVEGAAGSRYVEVPVTVTSHTADGRELRQAGSFAMRSSQVEGAAPGWRIVSADLRELQP